MKKVFLLISLIFLLLSGSVSVYSYAEQNKDLYLSENDQVIILNDSLKPKNNQTLIPLGAIQKSNDVYEVVFKYEIFIDEEFDVELLIDDLTFSTGNLSSEELGELFNFSVKYVEQSDQNFNNGLFNSNKTAKKVEVFITISMNEPTSFDQYQIVSRGNLNFKASFLAVK